MSTWVSIDRGLSWTKFSTLPTVAVHELAQHPTSGELIAGTYGRSIWVLDVTSLRQMTAEGVARAANLLRPNQVIRWRSLPERGSNTTREFQARTPNKGAEIFYTLARPATAAVLVVSDIRGREIYRAEVPTTEGLNRFEWNLRPTPPPARAGAGNAARFRGRAGGGAVPNGTYLVQLIVDGETLSETLTISGDPDYPAAPTGRGEEEAEVTDEEDGENEERDGESDVRGENDELSGDSNAAWEAGASTRRLSLAGR
jgi:hypothetical protein